MTGLIYTFINKENGKEYVGQTIQPIEVRDYAHYYEAFNQNKGGKFNNALRKYGKGGFIRSILHKITADTADELPTSLPVKGHCAYSVFDVRVTPAPTAAIASVAKSK
jgi:hypothetical protein